MLYKGTDHMEKIYCLHCLLLSFYFARDRNSNFLCLQRTKNILDSGPAGAQSFPSLRNSELVIHVTNV